VKLYCFLLLLFRWWRCWREMDRLKWWHRTLR